MKAKNNKKTKLFISKNLSSVEPLSALLVPLCLSKVDSQVLLAYCSHEEAQYLFRQASEVGLLGPGYIWILPSLAVGNPNSPPPISFPVGLIGVITDNWRKTLGQRVREGVAIVAKGEDHEQVT